MLTINSLVADITRVGQTTAKRLKNLDIENVRDLLFYFPFRYDDFSNLAKIESLQAGEKANIVAQIELIQNKRSPRRRMNITEALVNDGTESLKVIWFNQPFIAHNLHVGDQVSLAGKIEEDYGGHVMMSPNYEKITSRGSYANTQGLIPVYHLTDNITQKQLRFLIKQVIGLATQVNDWLPVEIKKSLKLLDLSSALKQIHFPKNLSEFEAAKKRLSFDELFLLQMQSGLIKRLIKSEQALEIKFKQPETKRFVDSLPFVLTDAQKKSSWAILQDLTKSQPMARLLQGDVGSGKTLVAVISALNTALNGYRAVIMVPTEILAKQHFASISKVLADFNLKIGLATRSEKKLNYELADISDKKKVKSKKIIRDAQFIIDRADIIIGTHALIQENIRFENLALTVIDEQHRFGVEQRAKLLAQSENNLSPHLLSMTATPIPRSLALALYGELDVSIINEMPKDRRPILTKIVPEAKRKDAYDFIRAEIVKGRQVFVICPLIDMSDKTGSKSAKEEFEKLDKFIFPDLKIGCLHGRMKAVEKDAVMKDFLENKTKILVSTSVIEVGVDVPNATIMMIEGADHFGLAQLHQFRGRVGRAQHQSYCLLLTDSDSPKTIARLETLVNYASGFDLAKMDLKFRGPGEFYGTAQKGFPVLKIATLFDYELMRQAKEQAEKIIDLDHGLDKWPLLKEKINDSQKNSHLE